MKKKILILMLMVLCSLTLLIPFTKKASAASLDITLQDYLLNYGDVINFKVGDSLTIVDAMANQYKYGTSATGSILNNGKNSSEYASLSVSINYPIYTFTNSGGTSFPISITNVGNNVVATFTSDFSCKIAASNNNSIALTFITCQLFNSSVGGYTEEDLQNKYDEAYKNSLLEMYTYYYNSKDLSNSIYASAYIPIETFETYDLESQKTALYNLIDAIDKQSNLETATNVYDVYYQEGFRDGKDSVDITIDNQDQYDRGYDAGYSDGTDLLDDTINSYRFGPLINSTVSIYEKGKNVASGISFVFDPNDSSLNYMSGNSLDLKTFADDLYFKLYNKPLANETTVKNFEVFVEFSEPVQYLLFSTKGLSSYTIYIGDSFEYTYNILNDFTLNTIEDLAYFASFNYEVPWDSSAGPVKAVKFEFRYDYTLYNGNLCFGDSSLDSFSDGYEAGLGVGYNEGHLVGYDSGYNNGYKIGHNDGYGEGYRENNFTFQNLFWTIGGLPFESFKTIWNVEFLGVNIANFITGLLLAGVAIFIIKRVI